MARKAQTADLLVSNALEFRVSRVIEVGLIKGPGGRTYSDKSIATVKNHRKAYTGCYGCYIYSVKAGRGFTPIYVGSATDQLLREDAFTSDKLLKCLQYLAEYKKGSLYITFVAPKNKVEPNATTHRGPCPAKRIQKLEKALTAVAYRKNRNLINKHNRGLQDFFINGVLNSNAGQPSFSSLRQSITIGHQRSLGFPARRQATVARCRRNDETETWSEFWRQGEQIAV